MTKDTIKSKVRHGVHVMFVSALAGANIATLLLLWFTCLSTHLDPAVHPRISQAGLLFPVFLGIDLLFILIWAIVSCRWILLPLMGIFFCWNYVKDYCPINWSRDTVEKTVKVMSFNVAGFANEPENGFEGWKTMEYVSRSGADVIFLQECPSAGVIFNHLSQRMDSLGYHCRFLGGVRIYSKGPFVGETLHSDVSNLGNGSYACLANIGGDTVLLINNHLQSNAISQQEKTDYGNAIEQYDKEKMTTSGRLLLSRLTNAAKQRAEQTDKLCELIKKYEKYSMIVGGDLNDTPISYTYQEVSKQLNNVFAESGRGLGISFIRKGFPVRIDHLFVSRDFVVQDTYIDDTICSSDHRPIITQVYKSAK